MHHRVLLSARRHEMARFVVVSASLFWRGGRGDIRHKGIHPCRLHVFSSLAHIEPDAASHLPARVCARRLARASACLESREWHTSHLPYSSRSVEMCCFGRPRNRATGTILCILMLTPFPSERPHGMFFFPFRRSFVSRGIRGSCRVYPSVNKGTCIEPHFSPEVPRIIPRQVFPNSLRERRVWGSSSGSVLPVALRKTAARHYTTHRNSCQHTLIGVVCPSPQVLAPQRFGRRDSCSRFYALRLRVVVCENVLSRLQQRGCEFRPAFRKPASKMAGVEKTLLQDSVARRQEVGW